MNPKDISLSQFMTVSSVMAHSEGELTIEKAERLLAGAVAYTLMRVMACSNEQDLRAFTDEVEAVMNPIKDRLKQSETPVPSNFSIEDVLAKALNDSKKQT